ncbi:MAG: hypothetical protein ACYC2Y_03800 [Armatimonadota bacterium]
MTKESGDLEPRKGSCCKSIAIGFSSLILIVTIAWIFARLTEGP